MEIYEALADQTWELFMQQTPAGELPKGPVLIQIDGNVHVGDDGRISRNPNPYNLRLQFYSMVIERIAEDFGVIGETHQGREGGKDFIDLRDHSTAFAYLMPDTYVYYDFPERNYVEIDGRKVLRPLQPEEVFTKERAERLRKLEPGEFYLFENARRFPFERKFNPEACPYIDFFKNKVGVELCIHEALPICERADSRVMSLPWIAKTVFGPRFYKELSVLHDFKTSNEKKAIIVGGAKEKFRQISKLAKNTDIFTTGIPGQIALMCKGVDIGYKNREYIEKNYNPEDIDVLRRMIDKYYVITPVDFVVLRNGQKTEVDVKELAGKDWIIKDMGPQTRDTYAKMLQGYDRVARAGPGGVIEEGHDNGTELVKKIIKNGFIAVGGDTIEELQKAQLCDTITAAGGEVILAGGAALCYWAEEPFPSVEEFLRLERLK